MNSAELAGFFARVLSLLVYLRGAARVFRFYLCGVKFRFPDALGNVQVRVLYA